MVSYFIGFSIFFVSILFFVAWKKEFFFIWPAVLFLAPHTFLAMDNSNYPVVSFYRALLFSFVLCCSFWVFLRLHSGKLYLGSMPFSKECGIMIVSMLLTSIATGFSGGATVIAFSVELLIPLLIYGHVTRKDEGYSPELYLKVMFYLVFVFGLYGYVAHIIGFNPYVSIIEGTISTDRVQVITYQDDLRGARAIGTFGHPMTYGCAMAIGFFLGLYVSLFSAKGWGSRLCSIVCSLGMLFFMLSSNSRSPLIMIVVGGAVFLLFLRLESKLFLSFALALLFLCVFFVSDSFRGKVYSLINIFDPSVGEDQSGSTLDMRLGQLEIAYRYLSESPVLGNGINTTREIVMSGAEPQLYNSESAIFVIMIDQGWFGLVAFLLFFFGIAFKFRVRKIGRVRAGICVGMVSGYFAFCLATGFMYTLPIFIYAMSILYYCCERLRSSSFDDGKDLRHHVVW